MRARVIAAMLAALAVFASGVLGGPSAHAEDGTGEISDVGTRAFQQLNACLSDEDAVLNALFVLDSSTSLRDDTDPDGLRFAILAQSLRQLGAISRDRTVNTAVASFDLSFEERRAWQSVDPDSARNLSEWALSDAQQWWGTGGGTDWKSALEEGDALVRQAPDFKTACNMLVWVTDGGVNVNGRWDDMAPNVEAMGAICGVNPATGEPTKNAAIVDSLRSSGVHLIGVLLQSDEYLDDLRATGEDRRADVEASRQSYMRPITEGGGTVDTTGFVSGAGDQIDLRCGSSAFDEGIAAGALLMGDNPIALAYQLGSLSGRIAGAEPVEVSDGPPYTFAVPAGANLIDMQVSGRDWTLTDPAGTVVASPTTADSETVATISEGGLSNTRITGPQVTAGTWTIDVTDPLGKPQVSLAAVLDVADVVSDARVGEEASVGLAFTDHFTGAPVSAEAFVLSDASVEARMGTAQEELACATSTEPFGVQCPYTPQQVGTALIDATVGVATRDTSAPLASTFIRQFDVTVQPAASFPRVLPDTVSLSDLDGKRGEAVGELTLVGPEQGSGEVCFPQASAVRVDSDVVDRAEGYTFTSSAWGTCVALEEGQQATVPISVTNPTPATGTVRTSFDVTLESNDTDATYPQTVSVAFDTIRQGSPPWWLLLLLTLVGVGVPLGLLYLQSWSASRLAMKGLRMAVVPVRVQLSPHGARVEPQRAGRDVSAGLIGLDDWQYLPPSLDRPRSCRVGEGITLAARTPRGPLSPLRAEAQAPRGSRLVSDGGTGNGGLTAPMGLSPAGQWIVVARDGDLIDVDPEDGQFPAELVAFVGGSSDANEVNAELSAQVQTSAGMMSWPSLIRQAGNSAGPSAPPTADGHDSGLSGPYGDDLRPPADSAPTGPPPSGRPDHQPPRGYTPPRVDDDPFADI